MVFLFCFCFCSYWHTDASCLAIDESVTKFTVFASARCCSKDVAKGVKLASDIWGFHRNDADTLTAEQKQENHDKAKTLTDHSKGMPLFNKVDDNVGTHPSRYSYASLIPHRDKLSVVSSHQYLENL